MEWEQVCDFSGWNAEIVKQLAIKTLPANILLNPFGKIEGKDMTEEAIKKKLKEIENTEKEKQQNRDLTEMEVIDSGSKESAAQTVHRMRRNEEQKRNDPRFKDSRRYDRD